MVAVVGFSDDRMGEEIKAYVVLNGNEKLSKKDLKNWIKIRIAANKYPREIEFIKKLPMSATGKILKRLLK